VSIQGSLEDVAVAEVLQFVHLGGSTGTLVLTRDDERVEIGFHEGGIINAWDSRSLRLGELLVERGLVSREVVECALGIQATRRDPVPSIGDILVSEGFVEPDDVREAVVEQIRQAVTQAIEWTSGTFVFVKGPPRRRDQFDPDSVLAYKLNTQALLLDIARALDHARRGFQPPAPEWQPSPAEERPEPLPATAVPPPAPPTVEAAVEIPPDARGANGFHSPIPSLDAEPDAPPTTAAEPDESAELDLDEVEAELPLVRVVSDDPSFATDYLPGLRCELELSSFAEAGRSPARAARVLVADMRPARPLSELAELVAAAGGAETIVLLPDVSQAAAAYAVGARAVLPEQPRALAGYVATMLAADRPPARNRSETAESHGFARLREIFADLRDSAPSATRILGLLRVASDVAQRAAVFVLLGDQVRVIGAFGRSVSGRPLADVLRKIGSFPLDGALREAAEQRAVLTKTYDPELLPKALAETLGPPANRTFLIVPVTGGDKVILLVYLDNEDSPGPIEGLDVVELAGAHIGLMFENELLKRRFGVGGRERRESMISTGSG
jgi:hypothetical protein